MTNSYEIFSDKYCKCKQCGKPYTITYRGWWQNHFYCGEDCMNEYNACRGCGYNKNYSCRCNEEE